jgi:hypothetical protein
MSRRIFRRRAGIVTGDLVQDPVTDITTLRTLPARDTDNGQIVLVRSVNQIYSFKYGDTTADDGDLSIAPTYDSAVGRWLKVTTPIPEVSFALGDLDDVEVTGVTDGAVLTYDDSTETWGFSTPCECPDLEAAEEVTFTGDVEVEGDLAVGMGLGSSGGVLAGTAHEADLAVADLTGSFSVKLGTRRQVPNSIGSRTHITICGVINKIGSPVAQISLGVNISDSAGVTAGIFITGNLADAAGLGVANNSEISARVTILFGPATSGSPTQRNIHVSGTCVQDRSGTVYTTSFRRFVTGSPPGPAAYGQGLTIEDVDISNDRVQMSVETNNNGQTAPSHYEFSTKLVTVDCSRGR